MRRKIAIFDVLAVRPEDSRQKIQSAWRRKAKILHPDVAKNPQDSGAQLAEINAAYEMLKSHKPFAERRKAQRRSAHRRGGWWTRAKRAEAAAEEENHRRSQAAEAQRKADTRRRADAEAAARNQAAEATRRAKADAATKTQKATKGQKTAGNACAGSHQEKAKPRMSAKQWTANQMASRAYNATRRALAK